MLQVFTYLLIHLFINIRFVNPIKRRSVHILNNSDYLKINAKPIIIFVIILFGYKR